MECVLSRLVMLALGVLVAPGPAEGTVDCTVIGDILLETTGATGILGNGVVLIIGPPVIKGELVKGRVGAIPGNNGEADGNGTADEDPIGTPATNGGPKPVEWLVRGATLDTVGKPPTRG